MSTNRTELRLYPTRVLGYEVLNNLLDKGVDKAKALFTDVIGGGGLLSHVDVSPTSPVSTSVEVGALEGMDTLGNHLRVATTSTVSCAADYLGTVLFPGGVVTSNLWIAIFAYFAHAESDVHVIGGTPYYGQRVESVSFWVVKGTSSTKAVNPGSGAVRICDIYLAEGVSSISGSAIYDTTDTNQDSLTPLTGYAKLSGANFTGDIKRNIDGANRPYFPSNYGTFNWGNTWARSQVDVSVRNNFPAWAWGAEYSGATIKHKLGNVKVAFKCIPCITEENAVATQANIETILGGNTTFGLAAGSIWTYQAWPYDGTITIIVCGTEAWVDWWRFAKTNPRLWTWVAWRIS